MATQTPTKTEAPKNEPKTEAAPEAPTLRRPDVASGRK